MCKCVPSSPKLALQFGLQVKDWKLSQVSLLIVAMVLALLDHLPLKLHVCCEGGVGGAMVIFCGLFANGLGDAPAGCFLLLLVRAIFVCEGEGDNVAMRFSVCLHNWIPTWC